MTTTSIKEVGRRRGDIRTTTRSTTTTIMKKMAAAANSYGGGGSRKNIKDTGLLPSSHQKQPMGKYTVRVSINPPPVYSTLPRQSPPAITIVRHRVLPPSVTDGHDGEDVEVEVDPHINEEQETMKKEAKDDREANEEHGEHEENHQPREIVEGGLEDKVRKNNRENEENEDQGRNEEEITKDEKKNGLPFVTADCSLRAPTNTVIKESRDDGSCHHCLGDEINGSNSDDPSADVLDDDGGSGNGSGAAENVEYCDMSSKVQDDALVNTTKVQEDKILSNAINVYDCGIMAPLFDLFQMIASMTMIRHDNVCIHCLQRISSTSTETIARANPHAVHENPNPKPNEEYLHKSCQADRSKVEIEKGHVLNELEAIFSSLRRAKRAKKKSTTSSSSTASSSSTTRKVCFQDGTKTRSPVQSVQSRPPKEGKSPRLSQQASPLARQKKSGRPIPVKSKGTATTTGNRRPRHHHGSSTSRLRENHSDMKREKKVTGST